MIVWALFDSGNGCYTQAAKYFDDVEIYAIGIDIKNKNNHFINLNLADYSRMFGNNVLFDTLDSLPKPDLIIASPPCESWSVASAMWGGNASWKQEKTLISSKTLSKFTIRGRVDYDLDYVQYKYEKSFFNRINGELCAYNTIKIIERYKPSVFVIENPSSSKIWHYFNDILGVKFNFDNLTYYGNYGYPVAKATRFKSNINLFLKSEKCGKKMKWEKYSRDYNVRSNIPLDLIKDIYLRVIEYSKSNQTLKVA